MLALLITTEVAKVTHQAISQKEVQLLDCVSKTLL